MNRHPAVLARMASTLQIASGGRLVLGIGIGGAPEGARGLRHRLPGRRPSGSPARGGGRGHPRAVDRRPGHARRRRSTRCATPTPIPVPDPPPPIIIGGETPAGARLAGRIGDGWSDVRRQLRGEPAAATSRRSRRPAGGARTSASSSASRATGSATSRSRDIAVGRRAARDLGALAGGRRRRRDRPGPDDRRRRRPGRTPSSAGEPGRSVRGTIDHVTPTSSTAPGDRPGARADPRRAPAAARPSPSTSACASAATRSGLRDVSASQVHGTVFIAVAAGVRRPRDRRPLGGRAGSGRSPPIVDARASREGDGPAGHAHGDERGQREPVRRPAASRSAPIAAVGPNAFVLTARRSSPARRSRSTSAVTELGSSDTAARRRLSDP